MFKKIVLSEAWLPVIGLIMIAATIVFAIGEISESTAATIGVLLGVAVSVRLVWSL